MKKLSILILASILFAISFMLAPATHAYDVYPEADRNYEYYGSPYFSSTGLGNDYLTYKRRVEIERQSKQPTWHIDTKSNLVWACNWVYKSNPGGWFCDKVYKFAPVYPNSYYYPYQCSYGYQLSKSGQFCEKVVKPVKAQVAAATPAPVNQNIVYETPSLIHTGPSTLVVPLLFGGLAILVYMAYKRSQST